MCDGIVSGSTVVCPLHGHTYDLVTGEELGGSHAVCAYTATLAEDGTILIQTGPDL